MRSAAFLWTPLQQTISAACLCPFLSWSRTRIPTPARLTCLPLWTWENTSLSSKQMRSQRVHPAPAASCCKGDAALKKEYITLLYKMEGMQNFGAFLVICIYWFLLAFSVFCRKPNGSSVDMSSPASSEENIGLFMLRKDSERRATLHRILTDSLNHVVSNIQQSLPQVG